MPAYIKEIARLNTLRNKERDRIYEEIYTAIRQEVGHNLSRKKAIVIWNLAYDWGLGRNYGNLQLFR